MKKTYLILIGIFLLSVLFQGYFALQIDQFSSDKAYFNLRHSEYIKDNFSPMFYDEMSYGGNYIIDTHIWHYFLALFALVLPVVLVYKILPILIASSIVFIVYLITKQITVNESAAMFGAGVSAFIPTFLALALNQISVYVVYVPLMLVLLYTLMDIKRRIGYFILLSFLLVLLQPMNFLVFFTLIIFLILAVSESLPIKTEMYEGISFFVLLTILVNLILFKNIYMSAGLEAIWKNIPQELLSNFFRSFDLIGLVYNIGLIPLVLGFIGFGIGISTERKKMIYVFSAVILADIFLLTIRLIPYNEGLMFLAIMLIISSTIAIDKMIEYLKITKASRYLYLIVSGVIIIAVVSLLIPATMNANDLIHNGVTNEEIEALTWIKDNTPENSVIMGNVFEGNLILEVAYRTNVLDTSFLLAEDLYHDMYTIYTTESLYKAGVLLKQHNVDYVYFSDKTKNMFNVEELKYTRDGSCFEQVFENERTKIYKVVC